MQNIETIGKVVLDYSFYSGEDLYSDGVIEDELLEIVKKHDEEQLEKIINNKNEWVYLYHFSHVRKNIISWVPIKKTAKILEIGSGCGAITGALASAGKKVDCVELSRKRSLINANRNKDLDGITIKVANFETIEPYLDNDYDIITLIGVWEYAGVYLSVDNPYIEFLKLLKRHLKSDGKIIIAIENKYGLKYWAGCREDHTAMFFEGLEGYSNSNSAITFGKNQMESIFKEVGLQYKFYYPYPDYKLPLHIFSDKYLPEENMLNDNNKNLDNTRMVLFDEKKVYNSIIQENMFPYFSNSFFVILSKNEINEREQVIYSKFSNERREEYRIRTDIVEDENGRKFVRKFPMSQKAKKHINRIYDMYFVLKNNTQQLPVRFNVCHKKEDFMEFEYIQGENLEKILNRYLSEGKENKVKSIINNLVQLIKKMENSQFVEDQQFKHFFGECKFEGIPAIKGADIDLIFSNIYYSDGVFNIIDYEWSFDFPIPINYILYRILYFQAPEEIRKMNFCREYGISEEEERVYEKMEDHFMRFVYKDQVLISLSPIIKSKYVIKDQLVSDNKLNSSVKVYYDLGEGFSEEKVDYFFYENNDNIAIDIFVGLNIKKIRVDPMEKTGIMFIKKIEAEAKNIKYKPNFFINGIMPKENYLVFDTEDPWLLFTELETGTQKIHIEFSLNKTSKLMVEEIIRQYNSMRENRKIKVYYDRGRGMLETDIGSFYYNSPENIVFDIPIDDNVKSLRIDPMESCGIVQIKCLQAVKQEEKSIPLYHTNGYLLENEKFIFDTEDPWIFLSELEEGIKFIHVELCIDKMLKSSAESMRKKYKLTIWERIKEGLK